MDAFTICQSVCCLLSYLNERAGNYREAKSTLRLTIEELEHICSLLRRYRGRSFRRKSIREIYEYNRRRIKKIKKKALTLYKISRTTRFFRIGSHIEDIRAIKFEVSILCNRVQSFVYSVPHRQGVRYNASSDTSSISTSNTEDFIDDSDEESAVEIVDTSPTLYGPVPILIAYEFDNYNANCVSKLQTAKRFKNVPIDCDWSRFATVYDPNIDISFYTFVASLSTNVQEMGLHIIQWNHESDEMIHTGRVMLSNLPNDVDSSCFDVTKDEDGSTYTIYLRKENGFSFYRFSWCRLTKNISRLHDLSVDGANLDQIDNVHWNRFFFYTDSALHVCFEANDDVSFLDLTVNENGAVCELRTIHIDRKFPETIGSATSAIGDSKERIMYQIMFHNDINDMPEEDPASPSNEELVPVLIVHNLDGEKAFCMSTIETAKRIKDVPDDCDWSRIATSYNNSDGFHLFVAAQSGSGSDMEIHMIHMNSEKRLEHTWDVLLNDVPELADLSCFDVTVDSKNEYTFYLKKYDEWTFYRFKWTKAQDDAYQIESFSIDIPAVEPIGNIDPGRWFIYEDSSYHLGCFERNCNDRFLRISFDLYGYLLESRYIELPNPFPKTENSSTSADGGQMYQVILDNKTNRDFW